MMEPLRHIGTSPVKDDAWDKVTGRAVYAADLNLPGAMELFVLRSRLAHAEIVSIDTGAARQAPGVLAIWTAADLPGEVLVGPRLKDEPVLAGDKVRRVGDPLALIAAQTHEQAARAADLVEVGYREMETVLDPESALAPGAPLLHEGGNLVFERRVIKGDAARALAGCVHVIENSYRTQMVEHAYLEPEAGAANWEGDTLVVSLPTKHAHFEQAELARVLDLPLERIRVVCTSIGGYFGDKQCLSPGYYAALAARLTGRPARMVYSREESFQVSTKRHPVTVHMTTGADAQGRLQAVQVEITADTGAYASYGPPVMTRAVVHAAGPYEVPNLEVWGRVVYTNNPVAGAMRGFGVPQVAIAHEAQMDLLAQAVGVSPAKIRRRNFLAPGKANAAGQVLTTSVGLSECLDKVEQARLELPPHPREQDPAWLTGWGLAATHYGIGLTGLPNPGTARAGIAPGEPVKIFVGTGDGGQGAFTTLRQIAAEELGVELVDVELVAADTAHTPNSGTSTASRITYVVGRSVQEAARSLAEELGRAVAGHWGLDEVAFAHGFFKAGERTIGLRQAADQILGEPLEVEASFDPPTQKLNSETGQGAPYATYSFAVQAAQVALERDTGRVEVLRMLAAHDVGRVIHPVNLTGQIQGAVMMGLGYALCEEVCLDQGRIVNDGFKDYHIPTSLDGPELQVLLVESPEPTGPFGAKGVAEPALLPTAPAIHNAVARALGQRIMVNPISCERVWRVLNQRRTD
jgi:nicotinate dehydrogenase large molybdopterin subunit